MHFSIRIICVEKFMLRISRFLIHTSPLLVKQSFKCHLLKFYLLWFLTWLFRMSLVKTNGTVSWNSFKEWLSLSSSVSHNTYIVLSSSICLRVRLRFSLPRLYISNIWLFWKWPHCLVAMSIYTKVLLCDYYVFVLLWVKKEVRTGGYVSI